MNKLGTVDSVNINPQEAIVSTTTTQDTVQIQEPQPVKQLFDFPTEIVKLPSKGLLYPKDHPLHSGQIEIKQMTAREEDILATQTYIQQGIVLDKLCEAIIATKGVKHDDLLLGDKNAILFAARAHGYGEKYETSVSGTDGNPIPITIDLLNLTYKEIDETLITPGENRFKFKLPKSGIDIEFKLLTVKDQKTIDAVIKSYKKLGPNQASRNLTSRLLHMITGVNGNTTEEAKHALVNNMLAADSRAFREYISKVQPDVDLQVDVEDPITGETFRTNFELGLDLFYPDFKG